MYLNLKNSVVYWITLLGLFNPVYARELAPNNQKLTSFYAEFPRLANSPLGIIKGIGTQGNVATIVLNNIPQPLNPLSLDLNMHAISPFLYQSLAQKFENNLVPAIARSWIISPDERTISLTLNPRAIFHDGTKITLIHIQQCLEMYQAAGRHYAFFLNVKAIRIRNSKLVILFKTNHYHSLQTLLTGFPIFYFTQGKFVASGPFKLAQQASDRLRLDRVNNYFFQPPIPPDQDRYAPPTIQLLKYQNLPWLIRLLHKAPLVQLYLTPSQYDKLQTLPEKKDLIIREIPLQNPNSTSMIVWNSETKPVFTQNIRLALSLLINRSAINLYLFKNKLEAAHSFWGNHSPYQGNNPTHKYDPYQAYNLFVNAKLGIDYQTKSVPSLSFTLTIPRHSDVLMIAQHIKKTYQENGIAMTIESLDWPSYHKKLMNRTYEAIFLTLTLPADFNLLVLYRAYLPLLKPHNQLDDVIFQMASPGHQISHRDYFKQSADVPSEIALGLNQIDEQARIHAAQTIDQRLFNQHLAAFLFEPTVMYSCQPKIPLMKSVL